MNIGIDCRTILNPEGAGEHAGVGHYTYFLVNHLLRIDRENAYVLLFDHRMKRIPKPFCAPNVRVVFFPFVRHKRFFPFVYSHVFLSAWLSRLRLDLYHGPANVLPYFYHRPSMVTVHDLAIYRHPQWFPSGQQFSTQVLLPASFRHASHLISVSESTKQDLESLFHLSKSRITTIYEGCDPVTPISNGQADQGLARFRLSKSYLFFVGTLEPRKNLEGLVAVFERLKSDQEIQKRFPDLQLVLAGAKGFRFRPLFRAIRNTPHWFDIKVLGYVTAEEKHALYQRSLAFVFPSLWEGFGLPVLEAMATGVPVVTSNRSALPEVVGDAGLLVNPEDPSALFIAIKRMLLTEALRKKFREAGVRRSERFRWEAAAQQTLSLYRRVCAKI